MITNPTVLDYVIAAQRPEAPRRHGAVASTTERTRLLRMPRFALALKRTLPTPRHAA